MVKESFNTCDVLDSYVHKMILDDQGWLKSKGTDNQMQTTIEHIFHNYNVLFPNIFKSIKFSI